MNNNPIANDFMTLNRMFHGTCCLKFIRTYNGILSVNFNLLNVNLSKVIKIFQVHIRLLI